MIWGIYPTEARLEHLQIDDIFNAMLPTGPFKRKVKYLIRITYLNISREETKKTNKRQNGIGHGLSTHLQTTDKYSLTMCTLTSTRKI